jgi:hypothetical protein
MAGKRNLAPITRQEVTAMVELYTAKSLSPAEIARIVDRPANMVTRALRDNGYPDAVMKERPVPALPPDRDVRLEAKRKLQQRAIELLDKMDRDYTAWSFGGRDNTLNMGVVPPSPRDMRDLGSTAVLMLDQAVKIDAYDAVDGAEKVKTMVGGLVQAMGMMAQSIDGTPITELAGEPGEPGPPRMIQGTVEEG